MRLGKMASTGFKLLLDDLNCTARLIQYTVKRDTKRRDALLVETIIKNQNKLGKTRAYWALSDWYYRLAGKSFAKYLRDNNPASLRARVQSVNELLDQIFAKNESEFSEHHARSKNLVWVMSSGRCGVDPLDQFLKTSPDLFSIHREFQGEKLYEHDSAVATKSFVFNMVLNGHVSENHVLEMTRKYLDTRLRTIRRTGDKKMVFCEHHDEAWLPFIVRVFPSCKIIHLIRNPVDVIQSYLSKELYSGRQIAPIDPVNGNRLQFKSLFALVCWFYAFVNTYICLNCRLIDPRRVLTVRSEDLFRADPIVFENLRRFLGARLAYEDFVRVMAVRHNEKAGGRNAFPEKGKWPQGFENVYQLVVAPYLPAIGIMD